MAVSLPKHPFLTSGAQLEEESRRVARTASQNGSAAGVGRGSATAWQRSVISTVTAPAPRAPKRRPQGLIAWSGVAD